MVTRQNKQRALERLEAEPAQRLGSCWFALRVPVAHLFFPRSALGMGQGAVGHGGDTLGLWSTLQGILSLKPRCCRPHLTGQEVKGQHDPIIFLEDGKSWVSNLGPGS